MNRKFKVVFYLRGGYGGKNKNGLVPIRTRIYLNNERIEMGSTGLKIEPDKWISKDGRAKGRTADVIRLNSELDRIEMDIRQIFRKLEFSDIISLERIKAEYLGKQKEEETFLQFFKSFLDHLLPEVGISRSLASYKKYEVLMSHFQHFLQFKYGRTDIKLAELNYSIVTDFQQYMLYERKCKHNTVMRMMRNLKTVTLNAQKHGVLMRDPFVDVKIRFKEADRGFLTDEEIQLLIDKTFSCERLSIVRDAFIFSCFTGLAYTDVVNLTEANIIVLDGREWIMTKRQKTEVATNIILLDIPKRIIEKYRGKSTNGKLLPICSNQKANQYLKEIADVCGINKNLTYHLARHTFATLALTKGVPIESVSKMLGHTNIRTTQLYAKIINKKVEKDMLELASKLDSFDTMAI